MAPLAGPPPPTPPTRPVGSVGRRRGPTAAVAWALLAALAAAAAAAPAAARSCEYVPLHQILASAGGIFELSDGRQLRGTKVDVGGCTSTGDLATGLAYPDANSNWTIMSHKEDSCVTGTGRDGSTPAYTGFQAILVEANGFKFSADMVLEGIDAQPVDDSSQGWRKTMSTLAMADGAVVRPVLTTKRGSLVRVQPFRMPAASLRAVGFPASDVLIDGAAYSSWTVTKSVLFWRGGGGVGVGRATGREQGGRSRAPDGPEVR